MSFREICCGSRFGILGIPVQRVAKGLILYQINQRVGKDNCPYHPYIIHSMLRYVYLLVSTSIISQIYVICLQSTLPHILTIIHLSHLLTNTSTHIIDITSMQPIGHIILRCFSFQVGPHTCCFRLFQTSLVRKKKKNGRAMAPRRYSSTGKTLGIPTFIGNQRNIFQLNSHIYSIIPFNIPTY